MIFIGNHLSTSDGFLKMGEKALELGADTFAFFTRNPRGGSAKEIKPEDAKALIRLMEENHFGRLVAHAPYTMNLCSATEDTRKFGLEMLCDDLKRMEFVPGNYYNFHPGSHTGQGIETGIDQIIKALNTALESDISTTVLLETMAGKGSEVGSRFEELKMIIDGVKHAEKLGVCLDTCHVYDAGYDIVADLDGVLAEFDRVLGLDRLKAVHINDSMNPKGSHKDRHQKIGQGSIGYEAFERIINHPVFAGKPFILETPNEDEGYKAEIAWVRGHMDPMPDIYSV